MNTKKLLASVLAGATMFSMMAMPGMRNIIPDTWRTSITASAATIGTIKTVNHVNYDVYTNASGKKVASVCGYDGKITTMKIPNTITTDGNTYTVCEIKDSAFSGSNLQRVYLQNATNLKNVGREAFSKCDKLDTVYLSATIEEMGALAFYHCDLLSVVEFASNRVMKSIPTGGFNSCKALNKVILPESIKSIGSQAFFGCSALQSISVPNKVTSIEKSAFQNCTSLQRVVFQNSTTAITFGESTFNKCSSLTSIAIPNNTTVIPATCFQDCTSLSSVTLPASLQVIEAYAFSNCRSWRGAVALGTNVKTIGDEAFFGCSKITQLTMPNSVTKIGGGVFFGCTSLASVNLSTGITALKTITNNSREKHGFFGNCSSLKSVQLPVGCVSFAYETFLGCSQMEAITFKNGTTSGTYMKTIDGVVYSKDGTKLLYCPQSRPKTMITLPSIVQQICPCAFDSVKNLRSITLTGSDTVYSPNSFNSCDALIDMTVPSSCAELDAESFMQKYEYILDGSNIKKVNNIYALILSTNNSKEPEFSKKFDSHLRNNFQRYCDTSFIRLYVENYADYVVKNYTNEEDTDLQKAIKLHDWLDNRVKYDSIEFYYEMEDGKLVSKGKTNNKNHVDASAFLHDRDGDGQIYTVCEGYARAYKILLNAAGIEAYCICGYHKTDVMSSHAWNLIKINGNYYHVDACWDDGDYIKYTHFMKTDRDFAVSHDEYLSWNAENDSTKSSLDGVAIRSTDKIGDLNQDGFYNQKDIDVLKQIVLKTIDTSQESAECKDLLYSADINMDGSVDILDVLLLKKILADGVSDAKVCTVFEYYVEAFSFL